MGVPKLTTATKTANFLTKTWKPIIALSAAAGVGFVGYKLYKWYTEPEGGLYTDSRYPKSTLTSSQSKGKADMLYNAMRTIGSVNDEEMEVIRGVLQGMTYNDFVAISQSFGERRYVDLSGVGGIWPAAPQDLVYWISKELDAREINVLRQIIPNAF